MGLWLVDLMSEEQLAAAAHAYHAQTAISKQFFLDSTLLVQAWNNHWRSHIRMPAGGAQAGGSMQTGFEMELLPLSAARWLMSGWQNHQETRGSHSWELRDMKDIGERLNFGAAGWGALNGKPIPPLPTTEENRGILLVSPPLTVTFQERADGTTQLTVRAPLTIWTEDNAMILPPDDSSTPPNPFYVDPPGQAGYTCDLFKTWAHKVLGELHLLQFPMTRAALGHLPVEYLSDSEESEQADERSISSEGEIDSSDQEGAHREEEIDSSDQEEEVDSSDQEGAHGTPPR